eukprot:CAMPEP_0185729666 /NCGR_PEP_ID=MMETSP1171-20130828/6891_1 /TAXON_ID=374046 /ORGANISM="Helicotheca tamensis, Strain CCMP826" /LENGTH=283 /DNA_ID=CAMNT_0028398559 /DNA_START=82 /DNA_END=933 /DNA_ORIENTATION=-
MMILRQSLTIACLLVSSISWTTSGFVVITPAMNTRSLTINSISGSSTQLHQSNENKAKQSHSMLFSDRKARITLPLVTSLTTLLGNTLPANAGIGTIIPFEETRKEKFAGSIANSVVLLRLKSSLRKRGYYAKKAVVGTYKPKDDLVVSLTREFGENKLFDLGSSGEVLEEFIKTSGEYPHALVLYGQDVTISPDGTVSDITGPDLKTTEASIMEKLKGKLSSDVAVIGGIVIHRTKSGGKDAGEDCFLPVSVTYASTDGSVSDLFGEVFGDLPTPRQTVVLR